MALGKGLGDIIQETKLDEGKIEQLIKQDETDREKIKSKLNDPIDSIRNALKKLLALENIGENEKIKLRLKYILAKIFFDPEERKKEFEELLKNKNATEEDKTEFLERYGDTKISSDDWKLLISESGINKWSMGDIGSNIMDRIDFMELISYFSLQATLRTGIHTGLGLQNIAKLLPQIKDLIFEEFKNDPNLSVGLALTEKESGSDLLPNIKTTYNNLGNGKYHIKGTKHLQGLTNEATHWIVLAKNHNGKDYRFFMIDTRKEEQSVDMIEEYEMRGLKSITYGLNKIDAIVDKKFMGDLISKKDRLGIRTLTSILYDSRLQFPAMLVGMMKRILDETNYKINLRKIAKGNMINNKKIINQVHEIELLTNIVDSLNKIIISKGIKLDENNTINEKIAIIAKTISTEFFLRAASIAKNLEGGFGFKENNLHANVYDDAWPFARFEGVNEMLYSQFKVENDKKLEEIEYLNISDKGEIYTKMELINILKDLSKNDKYKEEIGFLELEIEILKIKYKFFNKIK